MSGDFSRNSFDPARHFTRVLLHQGRVLSDSDFDEQAAIQQHCLRAFVVDLLGRQWRVGEGIAVGGATAEDSTIGAGASISAAFLARTRTPAAFARRRPARRPAIGL